MSALRDGGRTGNAGTRTRGRNILVAGEVALALVLLVGASLFMRSFLNMQQASPGFDTSPLMTMRVFMPDQRYGSAGARSQRIADIIARIERLPGVRSAAASNLVPLDGGGGSSRLVVEGLVSQPGREPQVHFAGVTSRFFETLQVPLLRGRWFTPGESQQQSAVAVVNVSFARRYLAGDNEAERPQGTRLGRLRGADDLGDVPAVGRRLRLLDGALDSWITVLGVVPDIMTGEVDGQADRPAVFVSYPHQERPNTGLVIRAANADPAQLTGAIRAAIRESDSGLPVFAVSTMEDVRRKGFWQYELFGWMFSIFGALALVLGSAGVYGVLSYAVSQRTQEFGVRLALGANAGDILRLTVRQGLTLIAAGVAVGVIGAVAVTRLIATLLYDVSPTDPLSFAAVALLLGAVGFLASYLPARRASRVDPLTALRVD